MRGAALGAAVVGGGWALCGLHVTSAGGAILSACAGAGAVLAWAAARSRSAAGSPVPPPPVEEPHDGESLEQAVLLATVAGSDHIRWALDQVATGRANTGFEPLEQLTLSGDPQGDALAAVRFLDGQAWRAVLSAAADRQRALEPGAELGELLRTFVPRLQLLVEKAIAVASGLEAEVEDPDVLHGLFGADHLLTQMRRATQNLAILSGSLPSRSDPPMLIATVIRSAISEIGEYARVRHALRLVDDALPGYVSVSVTHLLAELMENATRYSSDVVEIHTRRTPHHGVAVEITDRGPGMSEAKRTALNRLLAEPERENPWQHLREGRLGLLVAAKLAQRYRIRIELHPSILGGITATVLLPPELLVPGDRVPQPAPVPEPATATVTQVTPTQPRPSAGLIPPPAEPGPPHQSALLPRRVRHDPPTRTVGEPAGSARPALPTRPVTGPAAPAWDEGARAGGPLRRPSGQLMAEFGAASSHAAGPTPSKDGPSAASHPTTQE
ncbi:hypothetical protein K7472_20875 [Streptomyces sp. PTM05]|uniref:histidine kinase n=1 Tax=Streptantibioticus parmotrematis TaxID=2873249 RepID=A0ABS7QVQ5_9ACTN|nr:ATP-binding protein [Streptantibioticus parmotrematis]MBY8887274.1 hypothetical protein [Streptantibioticus parmotrematis]